MLTHFDELEQVLRDLGLEDRTVGSYVVGDPVALAERQNSDTARRLMAPGAGRG